MGLVNQYEIYLIDLDPTIGHEIRKTRPCLIISPDEQNHSPMKTVLIAPMTTKGHPFPTRIPLSFQGKEGWIVLDQIRAVDKIRLIRKLGRIHYRTVDLVKSRIREYLVD